jgi:mRNA interferase MazF
MSPMKRGEVWWVEFPSSIGGEIQKRRPAVIMSNDDSNYHLNRVQVVPLTRSVRRLFPSEAYVTLNGQQSKAMADQVTTVAKERVLALIGHLAAPDLELIGQAIRVQLALF